MTDPIADMLSRIRNAMAVRKANVGVPYSQLKEDIARNLVKNGFLYDVKVDGSGKDKELQILINDEMDAAKITNIKRLSRPGQRHYVKSAAIPKVMRGRGLVIISTSKGIMSGEEARAQKLGGELICEVY